MPARPDEIRIPLQERSAVLRLPDHPVGLVVTIAEHPGAGYAADLLYSQHLATLTFDSGPTIAEVRTPARSPPPASTRPFLQGLGWASHDPRTRDLPVGFLGFGRSSASALEAASGAHGHVQAVATVGGHFGGSETWASGLHAPALLLVSRNDPRAVRGAEALMRHAPGSREIIVFDKAARDLSDPGIAEESARIVASWFLSHFEPAAEPPLHAWTPKE